MIYRKYFRKNLWKANPRRLCSLKIWHHTVVRTYCMYVFFHLQYVQWKCIDTMCLHSWKLMILPFSCRSSSFNESEQVPGYQDFVTPGQSGSGKLKRKLPVVRKQRLESNDQGMRVGIAFSNLHTHWIVNVVFMAFSIWLGWGKSA